MNTQNINNTIFSIFLFRLLVCFSLCMSIAKVQAVKTVLLTGGAGFIGSHVAEELLHRGDTVILVDNFNDAYDICFKKNNLEQVKKKSDDSNLFIYEVDIRDRNAMGSIFKQHAPDVICHLAARAGVRVSLEIPEEYVTSNIIGTLNMFELAHVYGVKHIVYASSSSVYGNCGEGPFTENFDVSHPISPYAMTKCASELLAYTYYHVYGISSMGLRFFTVYGPRGRMDMAPFIFMDTIYKNGVIDVFGDGSSQRDFTYVDDIVDGIIRSIDTPCGYQVLNLGRGEPVVLKDFISTMEKVVGKKAQIQYKPMPATDVLLTHAQIGKAQNLLGYNPKISVEEGLYKMYDWYTNEYMLTVQNKR